MNSQLLCNPIPLPLSRGSINQDEKFLYTASELLIRLNKRFEILSYLPEPTVSGRRPDIEML